MQLIKQNHMKKKKKIILVVCTSIVALSIFFISGFFVVLNIRSRRAETKEDIDTNAVRNLAEIDQSGFEITNKITPEGKLWLLAASAIIARRNGESLNSLDSGVSVIPVEQLLIEWWGIYDRKDALETLEWLKNEGHTAQYDSILLIEKQIAQTDKEYNIKKERIIRFVNSDQDKETIEYLADFVWNNKNKLENKKLYAWDYIRLINVARWSFTVGYISEEEAWQYMLLAGKKLQSRYESWSEIGEHYLLGRTFWKASAYHPEFEENIKWLTNNPKSPWNTIPWSTVLTE
jgi:hypothetical protein